MRVAILAESAQDEPVIRVLVNAVLGFATDPVEGFDAGSSGWGRFVGRAKVSARILHYQRFEADGLVAVADEDDSKFQVMPVPEPLQTLAGGEDPEPFVSKRLEQIRTAFGELGNKPRPGGRPALRLAAAVAVPCLEAWLLCGVHRHATEAAMRQRHWRCTGKELRDRLANEAYGTLRKGSPPARERASGHASRLAGEIDRLERDFPFTFGGLARQLRAWPAV